MRLLMPNTLDASGGSTLEYAVEARADGLTVTFPRPRTERTVFAALSFVLVAITVALFVLASTRGLSERQLFALMLIGSAAATSPITWADRKVILVDPHRVKCEWRVGALVISGQEWPATDASFDHTIVRRRGRSGDRAALVLVQGRSASHLITGLTEAEATQLTMQLNAARQSGARLSV